MIAMTQKSLNLNLERPNVINVLSKIQADQLFNKLQQQLSKHTSAIIGLPEHRHTYIIFPSFTSYVVQPWARQQSYEERLLFFLGLLQQANTHLVYITASKVSDNIKSYMLNLMAPGVFVNQRVQFIELNDQRTTLSLAQKILAHPTCLEEIKALIKHPLDCHIVPYEMTVYEQEIALRLNIPIYGVHPSLSELGNKSNGRQIFKSLKLTPPLGVENIKTKKDIVQAIEMMHSQVPKLDKVLTITGDNGSEFAYHEKIADKLRADFYFAHPYSSWERGLNANTNGLVRQYFKKDCDFSSVTNADLHFIAALLHNSLQKNEGPLSPFASLLLNNSQAFPVESFY